MSKVLRKHNLDETDASVENEAVKCRRGTPMFPPKVRGYVGLIPVYYLALSYVYDMTFTLSATFVPHRIWRVLRYAQSALL